MTLSEGDQREGRNVGRLQRLQQAILRHDQTLAYKITYGWKLKVQPRVTTTYIATVTTQRLCYYPASRCAHPQGQVWSNAKSRPFTVRIRK
jgi:hypothetical protein